LPVFFQKVRWRRRTESADRDKPAITDSEYESHEIERRVLSKMNAELQVSWCRTEEEVMKSCSDADGLLNTYVPIARSVIQSLYARVTTRYGIRVDNIVLKLRPRGIYSIDQKASPS
jgi:hypothetical protein